MSKIIFDIVFSDLCIILFNLRTVQSASQCVKKIYQMFKRKGEGSKAFLTMLKKNYRISKEVHPLRK